jgi:hypothetical protein
MSGARYAEGSSAGAAGAAGAAAAAGAVDLPACWFAYRRWNRSTRPPVSMSFCYPV